MVATENHLPTKVSLEEGQVRSASLDFHNIFPTLINMRHCQALQKGGISRQY